MGAWVIAWSIAWVIVVVAAVVTSDLSTTSTVVDIHHNLLGEDLLSEPEEDYWGASNSKLLQLQLPTPRIPHKTTTPDPENNKKTHKKLWPMNARDVIGILLCMIVMMVTVCGPDRHVMHSVGTEFVDRASVSGWPRGERSRGHRHAGGRNLRWDRVALGLDVSELGFFLTHESFRQHSSVPSQIVIIIH